MPSDTQNKRSILEARHGDPFSYLGLHQNKSGWVLRVFQPHATEVAVHDGDGWQPLECDYSSGFYRWQGKQALPTPCLLKLSFFSHVVEMHDPYTFGSSISEHDLYLFAQGRLEQAYRMLGAHHMEVQGTWGVRFAV
jgi:1,4-alpha-glucan branching enzyme